MKLVALLLLSVVHAERLAGDFNKDGRVDFADFVLFAKAYGTDQRDFDLTGDQRIDLSDFVVFARLYGNRVVTFPEAGIEEELRKQLNNPFDAIGSNALANLRKVYLSNLGIEDLTGLEYLSGVEELHLSFNNISDLSPLSGLTELRVLDLRANRITDLSPLSNLKSLVSLHISNNDLVDLRPLSKLKKLQGLFAHGNPIRDLSPLGSLTRLTDLRLNGTLLAGSDLGLLANLVRLERLDLAVTGITDFSVSLPALEFLDVRGNQLRNVPSLNVVLWDSVLKKNEFDIDLIFDDVFTEGEKKVVQYAADRWMSIIENDLPDYTIVESDADLNVTPFKVVPGEVIDDIRIYVYNEEGYWGLPLIWRTGVGPSIGYMSVGGESPDIAMHEIGHVLGIGANWFHMLEGEAGEYTHFRGEKATRAFNDANRIGYGGPVVPVQKSGAHWHLTYLKGEIMSYGTTSDGTMRVSAITLSALEDLGIYEVDITQAEPYEVAAVEPPRPAGKRAFARRECRVITPVITLSE